MISLQKVKKQYCRESTSSTPMVYMQYIQKARELKISSRACLVKELILRWQPQKQRPSYLTPVAWLESLPLGHFARNPQGNPYT